MLLNIYILKYIYKFSKLGSDPVPRGMFFGPWSGNEGPIRPDPPTVGPYFDISFTIVLEGAQLLGYVVLFRVPTIKHRCCCQLSIRVL